MFEKITPEQAGISSKSVLKFLNSLEKHGIVMHSMLLMKGDKLLTEGYYAPFHADFNHRMYSQTKSYVGVAIGLLEEDGLINLDDRVCGYFRDKITRELPPWLEKQTVRDMLTMTTSAVGCNWFLSEDYDRTSIYFNRKNVIRPAGTYWTYDSPGSQVLCALVERVSGKTLFDFLYERIFSHLGTFKNATVLKTKNEDSWGDSALVCTPRDMASFARFVMNYGTWQGKRLMNENYLRTATSPLRDNRSDYNGFELPFTHGYGYQIWCTEEGGFAFCGMGGQDTVCIPKKDLIAVYTGDNQGNGAARAVTFSSLFDNIVDEMGDAPLPEDRDAYAALEEKIASLKLAVTRGEKTAPYAEEINGRRFVCEKNDMGIKHFTLRFDGECGTLCYENAQGEKELPFGLSQNVFAKFPEDGYSNEHGGLPGPEGFRYDCAASGAWSEARKFNLFCRVIDRYFGNLYITFAWSSDGTAHVQMLPTAENFLGAYRGAMIAYPEKE